MIMGQRTLVDSLNKFIWIDYKNKLGKVQFIKSKKIEDGSIKQLQIDDVE